MAFQQPFELIRADAEILAPECQGRLEVHTLAAALDEKFCAGL